MTETPLIPSSVTDHTRPGSSPSCDPPGMEGGEGHILFKSVCYLLPKAFHLLFLIIVTSKRILVRGWGALGFLSAKQAA